MIQSKLCKLDYKIVFLILNYETYWETNNCIKSLYKAIGVDRISSFMHEIIIVDNGSKNDSLSKLKNDYGNIDGFHILSTNKNLGFAKGNNLGFDYAKKNLNPDFIVMMNNDIIVTDAEFERKLIKNYIEYKFDIAGPMVRLKNGEPLNPVKSDILTIDDIYKRIKKLKRERVLCKLKIQPICAIFRRLKRKIFKSKNLWDGNTELNIKAGFQLHGCFLIFASNYINKFDGIYDKTFLYGEEVLLRFRCIRAGLKMHILENIESLHNESRTEKFIGGNINKRHLKRCQNALDSVYIIYEYMISKKI